MNWESNDRLTHPDEDIFVALAVVVSKVEFSAPHAEKNRNHGLKSYKYDSHQSRLRAFTPENHLQSG
jgi:hypothetical protein